MDASAERPTPTQLVGPIEQAYGLDVVTLTLLPIGNDAHASVYRVVDCAGESYLLKLRRGQPTAASLLIPRYLHLHDLPAAVAPLPTRRDELAHVHADTTLVLYPFIDGPTGMERGLSPREWRAFGELLQRLHSCQLPADLAAQLVAESYVPPWAATVYQLDRQIDRTPFAQPLQRAFATDWQQRRPEIFAIVRRAATLGSLLQAQARPHVLCHADIHTANLIVSAAGELAIVDWDGVTLAPKERDLIFVMERAVMQQAAERDFFRGYGAVAISPLAFAYYRYEWVVQEFADYGSRILRRPVADEPTLHAALAAFRALFEPGDVIAVARATEQDL